MKIDVAGKYVGNLDRDGVRDAGGVGGGEKRRPDDRGFQHAVCLDQGALLAYDQDLADAFDSD